MEKSRTNSRNSNFEESVFTAIEKGNLNLLKLMLQDSRFNPSAFSAKLFQVLFQQPDAYYLEHHGNDRIAVEILKLLLNDKRIDPSVIDNQPLKLAVKVGDPKLVELLLVDGRVDPTVGNDSLILQATQNGFEDVAILLVKYSQGPPGYDTK